MAQSLPSLLEIVSSTLDGPTSQSSAASLDSQPADSAMLDRRAVESSRQVSDGSVRPSQPLRESTPGASGLTKAWSNLKPGDLIAGKYRVERVLSQTRLLCAVQVRHLVLDTQATLKYLTPEAAAFPETISSFLRGARLLSQLHTVHIAAALDVGMLDVGTPYLVLEQPEGPDFAQVIRVRGALPIEEARMYVKQMCEGLAQAHALGLIHGGLRPTNIILTKRQDGRAIACVADFGNTDKFDFEELTRTDTGLCTPREVLEAVRYLSPDHARFPDNLDARCDVWAVGAIFLELLVGEPAFSAKTPAGLLASIAADELPPLRTMRPDAPETLEAVIRCCFAKQREARLPNGSQLLRALEASDDLTELSRPTRSSLDSIAPGASTPLASQHPAAMGQPSTGLFRDEPARSERVTSAAVMAVAAGLLVGGLAFVGLKLKSDAPTPAAPAAAMAPKPPAIAEPESASVAPPVTEQPPATQADPQQPAAVEPVAVAPIVPTRKVSTIAPTTKLHSIRRAVPVSENSPSSTPASKSPAAPSEGDPFGSF